MGEQSQVVAEAMGTLGQAGEGVDDLGVDLSRVRLAGNRQGLVEAERRGDAAVQILNPGVIAVEEGQEAGLGAGRPLDAEELQAVDPALDLVEVKHEFITPERRALADSDELGRLEVGVAEAREILPAEGEVGQGVDGPDKAVANVLQGLADQDQVGIVGDVTARGPEVDDRAGVGRGVAEGMDVGHHIVAEPFLVGAGGVEVDRLDVLSQLGDLAFSDVQTQLALGLGQGNPEASPGGELALRGPEGQHLPAAIAAGQGALEGVADFHRVSIRVQGTARLRRLKGG